VFGVKCCELLRIINRAGSAGAGVREHQRQRIFWIECRERKESSFMISLECAVMVQDTWHHPTTKTHCIAAEETAQEPFSLRDFNPSTCLEFDD